MRTVNAATSLLAFFILSGCTGSPDTGSPVTGSAIQGMVADGYISGATVCLDLNDNKDCDTDEPTTETDQYGSYTLENISDDDKRNHSVVVKVTLTSIDLDTPEITVDKEFTLTSPPGNNDFISPLTSLWKMAMESNANHDSISAENAILTAAGLVGLDFRLSDDFIAATSNNQEAIYTHALAMAVTDLIQINVEKIRTEASAKSIAISENEVVNMAMLAALDRIGQIISEVVDLGRALDRPVNPADILNLVSTSTLLPISFSSSSLDQQLALLYRRLASAPMTLIPGSIEKYELRNGCQSTMSDTSVPCYLGTDGKTYLYWVDGDDPATKDAVEAPGTWQERPPSQNRKAIELRPDGTFAYRSGQELENITLDFSGHQVIKKTYSDDDIALVNPTASFLAQLSDIDIADMHANMLQGIHGWDQWLDDTLVFGAGSRFVQRQTEPLFDRISIFGGDPTTYSENEDYRRDLLTLKNWLLDPENDPFNNALPAGRMIELVGGCADTLVLASNLSDPRSTNNYANFGCPENFSDVLNDPAISDVPILGSLLVRVGDVHLKDGTAGEIYAMLFTDKTVKIYYLWSDSPWDLTDLEYAASSFWTEKMLGDTSFYALGIPAAVKILQGSVSDSGFVKYGNVIRKTNVLTQGSVYDVSGFNWVGIKKMIDNITCKSGTRSDGFTPWC